MRHRLPFSYDFLTINHCQKYMFWFVLHKLRIDIIQTTIVGHWNAKVVSKMKFSSLAAQGVVHLITSDASKFRQSDNHCRRHNELDGDSTVYSGRRSKKTSKLRATGLYAGNSPVTVEFPAQRASDAENVILWRHRDFRFSSVWPA